MRLKSSLFKSMRYVSLLANICTSIKTIDTSRGMHKWIDEIFESASSHFVFIDQQNKMR